MYFNLHIDISVWILLGVCFTAALTAAVIGLRNMRAFVRKGRRMMTADPAIPPGDESLPGVSVIVYAKNAEHNIKEYLDSLLAQDYPKFEVIVVNDASIDNTAEIVDTLLASNKRLHYTFVPDSSRNVSRRKVAFTIGAKAAHYPVLLITASNLKLPSANWLRHMATPFANSDTELSLGTALYPGTAQHGAGKWYRQFDSLSVLTQWMGSAMAGHPYRGDAYSLAFRRDTFFAMKGFACSTRFMAGEDDIFVNSIAKPGNTSAVFNHEANPTVLLPEDEYPRLWLRQKERYTFTSRYLNTWALRRQAILSLCQWLSILSGFTATVISLPNIIPATAALTLLLLLWGYEICLYRRAATLTRTVRLFWSVPLFWLMRPLINAFLRLPFHAEKASNYTWQHPS